MVNPIETHGLPPEIPAPLPTTMTLEEFLESDLDDYEYVEGELIPMSATSLEHGRLGANVCFYLHLYVRENRLDALVFIQTGFRVGERVLRPDVAFLFKARAPEDQRKAAPVAPDLAVEIISPSDVSQRIVEKAFAYLEAGTRLVWVLQPVSKTVTVYRSETDITLLRPGDTLTGEDVVEGFACQVAELFE